MSTTSAVQDRNFPGYFVSKKRHALSACAWNSGLTGSPLVFTENSNCNLVVEIVASRGSVVAVKFISSRVSVLIVLAFPESVTFSRTSISVSFGGLPESVMFSRTSIEVSFVALPDPIVLSSFRCRCKNLPDGIMPVSFSKSHLCTGKCHSRSLETRSREDAVCLVAACTTCLLSVRASMLIIISARVRSTNKTIRIAIANS